MNVPRGLRRQHTHRFAQLPKQQRASRFDDGMHGVEPQTVEPKVAQPVERVLDGEPAHLRLGIVDRIAPRRISGGEELRRVTAKIIAIRPKVIIDDVEEHHQAALVGRIDQRLKVVGPPVDTVRRVKQNAVITPIPASREIRDRHQLDRGYPHRSDMIELVEDATERAGLGERPDVQLQENAFVPRPPDPAERFPVIALIDHLARPVDIFGLEARRRVRHLDLAVDPEPVAIPGLCTRNGELEPAVIAAAHLVRLPMHQVDALGAGRPEPEDDVLPGNQWPERVAFDHGFPAKTRIDAGETMSLTPGDSFFSSASTELAAVSSTRDQPATFAHGGKVNSTPFSAALNTMNNGSAVLSFAARM